MKKTFRQLHKMADTSLAAMCNAGVYEGKRVDKASRARACSVLYYREKERKREYHSMFG